MICFKDSYSEMMYFFQQAFELIAHAGGNRNNLSYKKAESMLTFPEVNALCLGYSKTRRGSGTSPEWAKTLTKNINSVISKGIVHISHFEEILPNILYLYKSRYIAIFSHLFFSCTFKILRKSL